jgi:PKD repeat protein
VTLTASNGCGSDGLTLTNYVTVSDAPPQSSMGVGDITVDTQNQGRGFKSGVATVTILDNLGTPVAGATVTGDFSGKTNETGLTAVTDAAGQATFTSGSVKGGGEWCFEVTGVTHATLTYDNALNAVTQACESGPVF